MGRVSLHGPRPCNLLELEGSITYLVRRLHRSQLFTRVQLHGPCSVVLPRTLWALSSRILHGSLQVTRVMLHSPCTVFFLWSLWFSTGSKLHGSVLCLHDPCTMYQQQCFVSWVFPSLLFYSYALELLHSTWKWAETIEFSAEWWNLQKLMNLMIMHEISYLNAMKCCTNVLKNIYIIQVYQYH